MPKRSRQNSRRRAEVSKDTELTRCRTLPTITIQAGGQPRFRDACFSTIGPPQNASSQSQAQRVEASRNSTDHLYDVVMRLHMPDGKPPTDHFLDGGPYDQEGASMLARIYTLIGENFCKPSETFGALPSSAFIRRPS